MTLPLWLGNHGDHTATHQRYRLTCAEYMALVRRSGGRCERCGFQPRAVGELVIDHDHRHPWGLRAVRGLLCGSCNTGAVAASDAGKRPPTPATTAYLANAYHRSLTEKPIPSGTIRLDTYDFSLIEVVKTLHSYGWDFQEFVSAYLTALADDPDNVIDAVRRWWPADH